MYQERSAEGAAALLRRSFTSRELRCGPVSALRTLRQARYSLSPTLYVVTHPEATHHVEGVVGGWHDSQLTPAGIRAAVSIARALRAQVPDGAEVELYSSDLQRTLRTAEGVAELFGVKPILDRRLREKSYGAAGESRRSGWTGASSHSPLSGSEWSTTRAWRVPRPGLRPGKHATGEPPGHGRHGDLHPEAGEVGRRPEILDRSHDVQEQRGPGLTWLPRPRYAGWRLGRLVCPDESP
ncbi:histidine phosphatase family protein [Streptomyces sp. NPDC056656]|uniref:histidine phosphatase family protein n=1 Tax=Streptomyces sp. NPDC056656 TaxID=3345895 RepID=UPI0036A88BAD